MYCRECGNQIPENALKCPKCGTRHGERFDFCNYCGQYTTEKMVHLQHLSKSHTGKADVIVPVSLAPDT